MMKFANILLLTFFLFFFAHTVWGQMKTESFEFVHEGRKLSGLLDMPTEQQTASIVVIIHGYGRSNVVAGNQYYSLRANFANAGIAVCIWDKPGCGKSEGVFDINRIATITFGNAKQVVTGKRWKI